MTKKSEKTVIGWSEYVELPDWGVGSLKAKVDTGARTSALHVEELTQVSPKHVEFYIVLSRGRPIRRKHVRAHVVRWGNVRSSSGHNHRRCFVETTIRIGEIEKKIELSLVSREKMLFRMLIGRKAIERDFLVDVSKRSVTNKRNIKRTKSNRIKKVRK